MLTSIEVLVVAATAIQVLSVPRTAFATDAADGGGSGPAQAAVVSRATASSSQGFRRDDAWIGAASIVALLSVGIGPAGVLRHRRVHRPAAG